MKGAEKDKENEKKRRWKIGTVSGKFTITNLMPLLGHIFLLNGKEAE